MEGNVDEVVVLAGHAREVSKALVQLAALQVKRPRLVEPALHARCRRTQMERCANRARLQSCGSGIGALGIFSNRDEVAAAKGYPPQICQRVGKLAPIPGPLRQVKAFEERLLGDVGVALTERDCPQPFQHILQVWALDPGSALQQS